MSEPNPSLSAQASEEDGHIDSAIRPRHLQDFVGQPAVHEQMEIFISAARKRGDALDQKFVALT